MAATIEPIKNLKPQKKHDFSLAEALLTIYIGNAIMPAVLAVNSKKFIHEIA